MRILMVVLSLALLGCSTGVTEIKETVFGPMPDFQRYQGMSYMPQTCWMVGVSGGEIEEIKTDYTLHLGTWEEIAEICDGVPGCFMDNTIYINATDDWLGWDVFWHEWCHKQRGPLHTNRAVGSVRSSLEESGK